MAGKNDPGKAFQLMITQRIFQKLDVRKHKNTQNFEIAQLPNAIEKRSFVSVSWAISGEGSENPAMNNTNTKI